MSTEAKKRKGSVSLEGWLERRPEKKARLGISFVECKGAGYPARTAVNVKETDGTLILAIDTSTPGEKLTKRLCEQNKKPYLVVAITEDVKISSGVSSVADWIKTNAIATLNIAGNCITRFPQTVQQTDINKLVVDLLTGTSLIRIQTGGQTGVDEAGAMAGLNLGIQTKVVAPRGWVFRGRDGKDVKSEESFKSRFA